MRQRDLVLRRLQTEGCVDQAWATANGVQHLPAVIRDLRDAGMRQNIVTRRAVGGAKAYWWDPRPDLAADLEPTDAPLFGGLVGGYGYARLGEFTDHIKRGWTSKMPADRFRERSQRTEPARFLGFWPEPRSAETDFKRKFSHLRVNDPTVGSEVYHNTESIRRYLRRRGVEI